MLLFDYFFVKLSWGFGLLREAQRALLCGHDLFEPLPSSAPRTACASKEG
jgi:hypothetical protein